jgi:SEC-C motif
MEMVPLTTLKKRVANKHLCPCGSNRRLGKCHNLTVNRLRKQLGRSWFRKEYRWLTENVG